MAAGKKEAESRTVHHETPRQGRTKGPKAAAMQPPLTPMIDVVFQLLLFFLIVCRFVDEGQIRANLPDLGRVPPPLGITVSMQPAGREGDGVLLRIESPRVELAGAAGLHEYLSGMVRRGIADPARTPVVIRPAGGVRWAHVVDAFNQAVRAKYEKVGFGPERS